MGNSIIAVTFNYNKVSDGDKFLVQEFVMPEGNITEESKNERRKRAQSIITTLFKSGKLKIGQKVYLKPAIEQRHPGNLVCTKIVNNRSK